MANSRHIGGFEIFELLGEGGMGAVFKARQTSLDRIVAIKILKSDLVESPEDIARFQLEARAAAKLSHPGIVQVYDAGEEKGRNYFAMEYIEGRSLGEWLEAEGRLSENDALAVVACVSEALANAWEKAKIIHRDLKPDNIMIDKDGTVKVADLGLVKLVSLEEAGEKAADEGILTPNYCSPEQAGFLKNIDFRSDIYSLGATLYHMLTGRLPFGEKDPHEAVRQQVVGTLPDPRDIIPGLSDGIAILLRKMMAKKPGQRYTDWEEVGVDIGLVTTGHHPEHPLPETAMSTVAFKASKPPVVKASGSGPKVSVKPPPPAAPGPSKRMVVNKQGLAAAGQRSRAKKKKKSPVGLVLSLLLLAGLSVGVYLYFQENEGLEIPSVPGSSAPVGKALTMKLSEAKAFAERYPEDYDGAIALYREAEALAAGTNYEKPVAAALRKLTQLRQQEVDGKMADLESRAAKLVANHEIEKARRLVLGYSGGYAVETLELRQVMAEELNSQWRALQQSEEYARREARRLQELEAAKALISPGLEEARLKFIEAQKEIQKEHEARRGEAGRRYRSLLEKLSARVRSTGDLDMVLEVKKEIDRFDETGNLPDRVEGTPSPLVKEVITRGALMKLDISSSLEAARAGLVAKITGMLEAEQKKLVSEDKLDQAVKIKEVLQHLKEKGDFPNLLPRELRKPAERSEPAGNSLEALLKG